MEPRYRAVGLGAGIGAGDGKVRCGIVRLIRLRSRLFRVGRRERDRLGSFHRQVGAQIRDALSVVVDAVEGEAEAGLTPAALHGSHG